MRKLAIALLAVPVLFAVYLTSVVGRSLVARAGSAVAVGLVIGVAVIGLARPTGTVATPPSTPIPLTAAAFRTVVGTDHDLRQPVTIDFTSPMDPVSVARALEVSPATPVDLAWDAADTVLTVTPTGHWAADTYHTITVDAGALAASGAPMPHPARAAFLTRHAAEGRIEPTDVAGERVSLDTAFELAYARPLDVESLRRGIRFEPAVAGDVSVITEEGRTRYRFTPDKPLRPGTRYHVAVDGVVDADGAAVQPLALDIRAIREPEVVRFRPFDDTTKVERSSALSVRFTQSMDRRTTRAAFTATAAGKRLSGTVRFAEDDTVLVFTPAKTLPWGAKVVMRVDGSARSADGAALGIAASSVFRTEPRPDARPATGGGGGGNGGGGSGGGGGGGGGGAVGGGSWGSVETYYLGLMNCTRTGGWVTSGGKCSSPGGRNVHALKLDSGISSKVSRPYAKRLATGNDCSHFIGGDPGDRLRRAGYTNYTWAENIGCRSGGARSAVLGSHLFFQSEKPTNGGHYRNLMNSAYDRVGIGVWVSGGRVRLVVDFYHP